VSGACAAHQVGQTGCDNRSRMNKVEDNTQTGQTSLCVIFYLIHSLAYNHMSFASRTII
jgi:hypothetical protein